MQKCYKCRGVRRRQIFGSLSYRCSSLQHRSIFWHNPPLVSLFCITRDSFLDRVFDVDELTALTEMLRYWFQTSAAGRVGRSGDCRCEARIYAFPRSETEAIRQRLQARSRQAAIDTADPDQLVVTGPATPVTAPADVGVWRQILSDQQLQHACVMLRFC